MARGDTVARRRAEGPGGEAVQDRWRAVNAPHLVALVRAGATFVNGKLIERPEETSQPEAA
jgi:hypothetical protein